MTAINPVVAPQPIANPNLPRPGQPPSNAVFFLRSTAPIFTVLNSFGRGSNVEMGMRPTWVPALALPPTLFRSRFSAGARPSPLTIEFETVIAGIGALVATSAVTKSLAVSVAGAGSFVSDFVRPLRSLVVAIAGTSSVVADQAGGTLGGGGLTLTPETGDQTLTLTEETGDSQTLTNEDPPDSLTITPA